MMMYKALMDFSDDVDGGVYRTGETYPRPEITPTPARVEYLAGSANRVGKPVIAEVAPDVDPPQDPPQDPGKPKDPPKK